jgi:hypothetical protein
MEQVQAGLTLIITRFTPSPEGLANILQRGHEPC